MRTVSPSRQIFLRKTQHLIVGVFNLTLLPETRKVKLYGCGGGARHLSDYSKIVGSCYVNGYTIPVAGGESATITVGAGATVNDTVGNSSSFIISGFPEKSITIPCAGFSAYNIATIGFAANNHFLDLLMPSKIWHSVDGKPIYGFGSGYSIDVSDTNILNALYRLYLTLGAHGSSYFNGYGSFGNNANGQNGFLTVEEYSE